MCWIAGFLFCILVIVIMSGDEGRLRNTSNEFLKWVAQVMLPITLLVLTRVFGRSVIAQFNANFDRKAVSWMAVVLSLVFIVFTIGTICVASTKCQEGSSAELCEYHQLKTLSNSGTTILIVIIWPVLSMLLDYLFPKSDSAPANPTTTPTI